MKDDKKISALIIEGEEEVAEAITRVLKARSYSVTVAARQDEALVLLRDKDFHLAFVGESEGNLSVFYTMEGVVKTSPMTAMILVTDLPEGEVEDRAEGYGILGSIGRSVPGDRLARLLVNLEKILGRL
ncbi:MAG: hypothetical protein JRJ09_08445 [Deltaproteobacteria bacterium]|nr:hypothetical protein [Deltaproteobacteria bacterium]